MLVVGGKNIDVLGTEESICREHITYEGLPLITKGLGNTETHLLLCGQLAASSGLELPL